MAATIIYPTSASELIKRTRHMSPAEKKETAAEYFSCGNMLESRKETQRLVNSAEIARFYFEASAKLGHVEAQNKMGIYHSKGKGGLPINDEKAVEAFTEAAHHGVDGCTQAKRNLAKCYARGLGGLYQETDKPYMLLSEVLFATQ